MANRFADKSDDFDDIQILGGHLRDLREAQGLSYDDVARATHVRPHLIKAIEEGRIGEVAAPIYARGFVKSYCEYLMAEDLWKKYTNQLPAPGIPKIAQGKGTSSPMDINHPTPIFRRSSIIWVYILLVVAVLGAAFLLWSQRNDPGGEGTGFFLRTSPREEAPRPQTPQESVATSPISDDNVGTPAVVPVSGEARQESAPVSAALTPAAVTPQAVDLTWLDENRRDGVLSADHARPQTTAELGKLLVEINAPVRLIVDQDGSNLTRRSMVRGDVRSYDVTVNTTVSLSAGNAASITWHGQKYTPAGNTKNRLVLVFHPDGKVQITEGSSSHFQASGSQRRNP